MSQVFPEPTVGAFIFNQAGQLLLVQTHKFHDMWVVPGGHIELGESIEEALLREVKEETGLEVYDPEFINYQQFIYDQSFWKERHFIFFDFACKTDSAIVTLNDEAYNYCWVNLETALEMNVNSYTANSIRIILQNQRGIQTSLSN